jgi:hypothetical protein
MLLTNDSEKDHIIDEEMKNMLTKRMKLSLITGAILGVVCIIGALVRSGFKAETYWLFALWYNRLLMGFVIGLPLPNIGLKKAAFRGALLGLFVSFAFYSATGFGDVVSFLAGIIYGIIIEYFAFKYADGN